MLSDDKLERYARQVILEQIGEEGQQKLANSKIMVHGLGGLGCPAVQYLALAGVGALVLVDHDHIELSNLARQPLYEEADIGRPKSTVAAEKICYIQPDCCITTLTERLDAQTALAHGADCTLWVDATDHYQAREQIAQWAVQAKRPLISASVQGFQGHITTLPADPNKGCFHDLYPHRPQQETVSQCEQVGILGGVAGVLGSMVAVETVKEILSIGQGLVGRMLMYDGLYGRVQIWDILQSSRKCVICSSLRK